MTFTKTKRYQTNIGIEVILLHPADLLRNPVHVYDYCRIDSVIEWTTAVVARISHQCEE
jgi:hypothetical protein